MKDLERDRANFFSDELKRFHDFCRRYREARGRVTLALRSNGQFLGQIVLARGRAHSLKSEQSLRELISQALDKAFRTNTSLSFHFEPEKVGGLESFHSEITRPPQGIFLRCKLSSLLKRPTLSQKEFDLLYFIGEGKEVDEIYRDEKDFAHEMITEVLVSLRKKDLLINHKT